MSPHARQTGDTEAMRSHLTSQMEYMRKSPGAGWRPGFTPGKSVNHSVYWEMCKPTPIIVSNDCSEAADGTEISNYP